MNRPVAFLAALVAAAVSVSSACIASSSDRPLTFTLQAKPERADVQLSLHRVANPRRDTMSTSFAQASLDGLDAAALRSHGRNPLRFSYLRDAGRVDCHGLGGDGVGSGQCAFAENPAFSAFLLDRGVGKPTSEQAYALTMTGATRDLVEAVGRYGYQGLTVDKLVELSAVGVTRNYLAALSSRGFKPTNLDGLTELAALDVTPDYIDALGRAGYANLGAEQIGELKAVGINPGLIAKLASAGYGKLPVDQLVQMAALDIDPAFINGFARIGYANLPVETLVQLKALDVTPAYVQSLRAHGLNPRSADQLVKLKAAGLGDEDR